MSNNLEHAFHSLHSPEPSEGLLQRVLIRIQRAERRAAMRRVVLFSAAFVGSLIAMIPASRFVGSEVAASGFTEFFSLLFSDTGSVFVYWQDFTAMLIGSLPAVSLAVFLAILFTLLESLRFLIRNITVIYEHQ